MAIAIYGFTVQLPPSVDLLTDHLCMAFICGNFSMVAIKQDNKKTTSMITSYSQMKRRFNPFLLLV